MKNKLYILLFLAFLFSGTTLWAQQKATPKAGEGISSFLLRHNRSPKKYYDDFIELNKQKLGKNNVLKVGVTYVIPPIKKSPSGNTGTKQQSPKAKSTKIGTTLNQPLFGKQLADVKVTSNRLAGACFYVVSGHGGPDPGAIGKVGKYELHEDEYAYDIAFYYSNKKGESKRLANNMKNTFESKYDKHQPNRGFSGTVSGRNLYVLSHTTPASVFVELGNIQNTFDQRRLVMNSNRQALAKWLMEGFLKDYKEKR